MKKRRQVERGAAQNHPNPTRDQEPGREYDRLLSASAADHSQRTREQCQRTSSGSRIDLRSCSRSPPTPQRQRRFPKV